MVNERNVLNNTPRIILNGIDNRSIPSIITSPQVSAIHLPLFYLQTQKGPDIAIVNNYSEAVSVFGEETFNVKSDYFNHASALALRIVKQDNPIYIRRIIRDNETEIAKEASGVIAVEIDNDMDFLPFVRLSDGTVATRIDKTRIIATIATGSTASSPKWRHNNVNAVQVTDAAGVAVGEPGWIPTSTINLYPFSITHVYSGAATEPKDFGLTNQNVSVGQGVINSVNGKVYRVLNVDNLTLASSFSEYTTPTVGYIYGSTDGITLRYRWFAYSEYEAAIKANTFNVNRASDIQTLIHSGKTYYPLFYFESSFKGVYGNKYGIRLWTANKNTISPTDADIINDQEATIYNAQLVYKSGPTVTPAVIRNKYGESILTFTPKKNAFNYKTNELLRISNLITNYSDDGSDTGLVPNYGPLGKVIQYTGNIRKVLRDIQEKELTYNPNGSLITSMFLLDLFSASDYNGIPFIGYRVAPNGARFNSSRSYMLTGGNDGDLTNETFEASVISEIENNTENDNIPLLDMARFPFSCVYDSGFSVAVKNVILSWPSKRKNVHVAVGTHVVNEGRLSVAEEHSVGIALINNARLYSESEYWNTPATRAIVMAQSGVLINDPFTDRVSTVFQLAEFRAKCLGSQSGAIKSEEIYDSAPKNIVNTLKNISSHYLNETDKANLWLGGLNYALSFDTRSFFFPSLQTVYGIGQSILSNELVMQICADLELKADRVWRHMVGNYSLTDVQFTDKSNKIFNELTNGIYGNAVRVSPNTYFTPMDVARNYSWVMDITVYGRVPKTVGEVNIIAKRDIPNT